jgi:fatty acid-binding protein DegV
MKRFLLILAALAALVSVHTYQPCHVLAGVSSVSLSINKSVVEPGEEFTVSFSVDPALPENAWIGIVPSNIKHGSESLNDQHDLTYQYIQKRTSGTMTFKAPATPGSFDIRFNDTDNNGLELAFVSFTVAARASAYPAAISQNEAFLRLDKNSFQPGEPIKVYFTALSNYAADAWIGIIPSQIAHGSEALNDQHDLAYQYINKRTSGEMTFNAPSRPGSYDFRMNDTDKNGREVASITFFVY